MPQLINRLANVQRQRRKWARRHDLSAWRVYDHDLADQPAVVEWYDGAAVLWAYDRTRNETAEDDEAWLAALHAAVATGLGLPPELIFLKRRLRQRDRHQTAAVRSGAGQYQRIGSAGVVRTVREAGLLFEVNLSDYLDTGLFLDHRPARGWVRAAAAGKRVLNLFAYTGAFTVHARAGGAAASVSVDLSATYLAWAARNSALNHQRADDPAHQLVRADCLSWLKSASGAFDLIICDPPTFSNSAAMAGTFDVQRDQEFLLRRCVSLLAPGGTLWFSTNRRGFRLDTAPLTGCAVREVSAASIPEDMRDRRIHQCWQIGKA